MAKRTATLALVFFSDAGWIEINGEMQVAEYADYTKIIFANDKVTVTEKKGENVRSE